MELQNTPMTVQLGQGARIQLANAIIETGNTGATIQFGTVDLPAITARIAGVAPHTANSEKPARRPRPTEAPIRRVHLPAPRPTTEQPRRKVSVFERLSQSEAPTAKRVVSGGRISMMAANTTTLPTGLSAPGRYDAEASSSGGRLTRRQRRKKNAELRAQQQFLVHPSNLSAQEVEANVPTRNKFSDLKWVKRNSPTGELKQSFWDQRHEVPVPQKKREPETLSARVYRVLKTVKEKGLQKRSYQRPVMIEARRAPPRERRYTPRGEHRGVTPERLVQGSAAERSRWKGKQIWRPKPRRDEEENKARVMNLGVTSDMASRRSAPNSQEHQRRVQKKTHDDIHYDGRHLGESSRGSRRPTTPPKEESNFDRSPRVEEISLPNQEPEIQWRRRSEIRVLEVGENIAEREENMEEEKVDLNEEGGYIDDEDYMEDEQNYLNEGGGTINEEGVSDTLNMEVIYMVRHVEADYDDDEDDGDWQPLPREGRNRQRDIGSIIGEGEHSPREQEGEEVEENPFDVENTTLADMRRQMRRQMRAKDREISQLNEKVTEMMAQMTAMMQMMQRNVAVGPTPTPPVDPPNLQMPQISGIQGIPGNGQGAQNITRQPTPQNIASTSEPVTAAHMKCEQQLEEEHAVQLLMGNIDDKMQPFLCMATITTFQDLLDRVAKFEKLNLSKSESLSDKSKKNKSFDTKKGETYSASSLRPSKGKQLVYNVDKGKQPMKYEEKPKQVYNPNPQPKLILGGNDRPQNFQGGGERPRQTMGTGVPGVKWKSPIEPVLNVKGLPKVQTSTFTQRPDQASSSKPDKVKFTKRKTKLKKPKEKKNVTQRVIDSLDEYYQTVRQPIRLADFMSGLKVGEAEDDGDANSLPTGVCRVISVVSGMPVNEEHVKEVALESCMVVSPMDYSLEEDLYFPEEGESDPEVASQMERINLGGDSEPTDESPDAIMADSEENMPLNEPEQEEIAQKPRPSSSLEAKASNPKAVKRPGQGDEKKQVGRKKASPTLPKIAVTPKERKHVPHLGSDTDDDDITPTKSQRVCQSTAKGKKKLEYADSDYDYESTYTNTVQCVFSSRIYNLSISDSVFVVTRIPLQHFIEIAPREVHSVEELVTFYVPPHRKRGGPGTLFYKGGEREEETKRDWFCKLINSGELIPTRMPRYNTRNIQRMLRRQASTCTSAQQLRFCLNLWHRRNPHALRRKDIVARRGLGYKYTETQDTTGVQTTKRKKGRVSKGGPASSPTVL
ncbi:hypothetical protein M5K25_009962 [Dendrobium thyrsiflorum]|uniref:Uncharacterized protein n=1 Tax=Dendrobium thyrsiflorum TaxID=117978 RepID=A0ABD0V754_DENTH